MRFVINYGLGNIDHGVPIARAAEAAGFASLGIPDSFFYPKHSDSRYPYTPDGGRSFIEHQAFLDPCVWIATMAAVTTRLRFYPSVYKLPARHPLAVAKMFSSLAHVTGNRVALGVGLSPWLEDFTYLGLDWESRGRRMDECIRVVRGALTGEYFAFEGEFFRFGELRMKPVPTEPLRILIGGHSEPALKRAARVGDGWVSANSTYEELAALIPKLQGYRREFGTADRPFEIHAFDVMLADTAGAERLAALGVTDAIAVPWNLLGPEISLAEKLEGIARFGNEVIARFR